MLKSNMRQLCCRGTAVHIPDRQSRFFRNLHKAKNLFVCTLFGICIYYMCTHFVLISKSVIQACELCISNVIPSLFPFFILADIFTCNFDPKLLPGWISRAYSKLFKIPASTLPVFISGILSGYPVGASGAYQQYKDGLISKPDAQRLICFTNNSGPLFVISAVGSGIFGNVNYGIMLYIIHILCSAITGAIISAKCKTAMCVYNVNSVSKPITDIIEDSFMKCIKISGFIILFSIINGIISMYLCNYSALCSVVCCITEITNGIAYTAMTMPTEYALPITAFALGWSGISVLLQVTAVTHSSLSVAKYIVCKLINGCMSAVMCSVCLTFAGKYVNCFADGKTILLLHTKITYILIIVSCLIMLIYLFSSSAIRRKR